MLSRFSLPKKYTRRGGTGAPERGGGARSEEAVPRAVPDPLGGKRRGRADGRARTGDRSTFRACTGCHLFQVCDSWSSSPELRVLGPSLLHLVSKLHPAAGTWLPTRMYMYTGIGLLRSKLHPASRPVIKLGDQINFSKCRSSAGGSMSSYSARRVVHGGGEGPEFQLFFILPCDLPQAL